jgi:hypothetical protein
MSSTMFFALILLPLFGAALIAAWPAPAREEGILRLMQGWTYPAVLLLEILLIVSATLLRVPALTLPLISPLLGTGPDVTYLLDNLAVPMLLALLLSLLVVGLMRAPSTTRPLRSSAALFLVAATIGALTGQTLYAICLAWGAADLAFVGLNLLGSTGDDLTRATREIGTNLASTCLLIAAATVSGGGAWGAADWGIARELALVAALLRLGVYLAPGSARQQRQGTLFALVLGGGLWLRLTGTAPYNVVPPQLALSLGAWALLATAFIAARSPSLHAAMPYLVLHSSTIAIMASLADPATGILIALASLIQAILCLTLIELLPLLWPADETPRLGLGLWGIALASLGGIPLTLGFWAHWGLLRIAWLHGAWGPLLLACLSYALVAMPLWRHGLGLWGDAPPHKPASPLVRVGIGGAIALGLMLIVPALYPPLMLAMGAPFLAPPTLGALLQGPVMLLIALLLIGSVAPAIAGLALIRVERVLPPQWDPALNIVAALLEVHWLYDTLDPLLAGGRRGIEMVSLVIDSSLYLGWTIAWSTIVMLQLT